MKMQACPHCRVRVVVTADGDCPSCRQPFDGPPTPVGAPAKETPQKKKPKWFQFSLLQLLIGVALFACVLSGIMWHFGPVRLTGSDNLARFVGRRVTFVGVYSRYDGEMSYFSHVSFFGKQRIDVQWQDYRQLPNDGQEVTVTGWLEGVHLSPDRDNLPRYFLSDATWHK